MSLNSSRVTCQTRNSHSNRVSRVTRLLLPLWLLSTAFNDRQMLRAQSSDSPSQAARPAPQVSPSPLPFWTNRGRWNFGFQVGFALENSIPRNISHIAILIAQPHIALIGREFQRSPVRRFEIVSEGIFGNAVHPGGHLIGAAILFRLDGKSYGRFVPFWDAGGGIQHTTLAMRAPELSGRLQFSPQVGLGILCFVRPQRAWVLEYRYLHMSNAGIEPPNHGFNASMLSVGFRWFRRPRPAGWQPSSNHSWNPFRLLLGGK